MDFFLGSLVPGLRVLDLHSQLVDFLDSLEEIFRRSPGHPVLSSETGNGSDIACGQKRRHERLKYFIGCCTYLELIRGSSTYTSN